jgi:hypothetical protein
LHLPAGEPIDIACTYDNTEDFTLFDGPSDKTQEMCVLSAEYFPQPSWLGRTIRCQ